MKLEPSPGAACTDPIIAPTSVRVLRKLGQGRAAQAQLVEAFMPDGRVVKCVEKVFAPGLLTRIIYRLSFQSPFAYQSNRDAILTCFYRRRVAAVVLAVSNIDASIARPLYVRFDEAASAWVLAAEWIDGRGIKPAAADDARIRRWLSGNQSQPKHNEINELIDTMGRLEQMLVDCGLVGSGWQVAPRALVSTANLLRTDDHYTVIDLESGIPAILVPRYLLASFRSAALPPFDDLNADQLRSWIAENECLLTFRIDPATFAQLRDDTAKLIEHSSGWKDSEFALFRRPWRLLTKRGRHAYQQECLRRWQQDGVVDTVTAKSLGERPIKSRMIWYSGILPSSLGRFCSRLIGRRDYRELASKCLRNRETRIAQWQSLVASQHTRWMESGRIPTSTQLTTASLVCNWILQRTTPTGLHRFISDARNRRDVGTSLLLLLFSSRYQTWFGQNRIDRSIDRWAESKRITEAEVAELRSSLSGTEVRAYVRGFGMHVALKALAPIILPAKLGGIAAFLTGGNPWFLLLMLVMPAMRTMVTLANWWTTRREHIAHGEALATCWLPIVGSVAFPLQMFAARPKLSTFLIRDIASKLGQRIPVYGGADSRTEIALIRASDFVVEFMRGASSLAKSLSRTASTMQSGRKTLARDIQPRTRFGKWIDHRAAARIIQAQTGTTQQQIPQEVLDALETRAA